MGRPREYDAEAVVARAMELFWRRGFSATSMAEIYEATGLKPGSIYAAFGDKETLFRRAFEAYVQRFRSLFPKDAEGLAAIRAWLDTQVELAAEDPARRGCLIINTVLEREAHSPATQAMAQGRLQEIRGFFLRHLIQAQQARDLPPGLEIEAKADALLGAVVAIMSLARAGADRQTLEHVARSAMPVS
jgi:TetR/AcrR family transcriptional repressor of nem operon